MPATDITQKTVARVLAEAKPGAPRVEITDSRTRGLVLRAGARGTVWQFRYKVNGKGTRLTLGAVQEWSIADAREIAGAAAAVVKSGRGFPDAAWLEHYLRKTGKVEWTPPAAPVTIARTWRLEQGREKWLEEIARTRRAATHADYRNMLMHPAIRAIETRPLAGITRQELAAIVAAVHAGGHESTAEHLVRVIRPFWKWLAADAQSEKSGVKPGVMADLSAPERTLDEKPEPEHVPSLEEVARVIAIARSGAIDPIIGCAVEWVCWTLQRRRAVASAETGHVRRLPDGRGIWMVPPPSRKTRTKSGAVKRDHAIPLPLPAMECFKRAEKIADAKKSPYLFPQFRPRRVGGDVAHLSVSAITHTVAFMPGVVGSPHDIRRAFATHGEDVIGWTRGDTQAILDHASGSSDVTGAHYALHDGTHRTWAIMHAWADALVPEIEKAVAQLEPVEEIKAAIAAARYKYELEQAALKVAAE